MAMRRAHLGLHFTILLPALLGVLGLLAYGAVYGRQAPSLAGEYPGTRDCLGDRLAVEAWPVPRARIGSGSGAPVVPASVPLGR